MSSKISVEQFALFKEKLTSENYLYKSMSKSKIGNIVELALTNKINNFTVESNDGETYNLIHLETNLPFKAQLKIIHGRLEFKSNLLIPQVEYISDFSTINLKAKTLDNKALRPAQIGALHSLLAHWSLSNDPATIVLPTGTGKTETMLLTSLVEQAIRTLIIVPTLELKDQIFRKFQTWGILKELGVIPIHFKNPKTLALAKTIKDDDEVQFLKEAEIVISTPALLARCPKAIQDQFKNIFTHVFFDEAHHIKAKEWDHLKHLFSSSKIVQFTATPYRLDRQPIEGKVVYNYPLSQALKDNCFSKISLISVDERNPNKKDFEIAHTAINKLYEDRKEGFHTHKVMVRAETKEKAESLFSSCIFLHKPTIYSYS